MSDRTPFTSPPLQTQSGDDTNSSITGGGVGGGGDEKRNGIGVGGSSHDFRQNHTQMRTIPPQPHELTAEWTVRAQLTFARAGEKVKREFSSNDPLNPVRVVYKWSTLDATAASVDNEDDLIDDDLETTSTLRRTTSSHCSGQSTPSKRATPATPKRHQSFRSTSSTTDIGCGVGGGGVDSAFSGSRPTTLSSSYKDQSTIGPNGTGMAAAAFYGTRCRSTCNIVVSAVADFLPPNAAANDLTKEATRATTSSDFLPEMEPDPFVYNTTAAYTVLPQKSMDDNSTTATTSKSFTAYPKMLNLRDAFCQTSDTETKYMEDQHRNYTRQEPRRQQSAQQHQQGYQRRLYDQRRSTAESLLQPTSVLTPQSSRDDNESNVYMHSTTPTPTATFKSASMSRIPQLLKQHQQQQQHQSQTATTEPQKKPRTVHIDVYCTGSEDDDQADAEASSSSDDDDSKRHEVDSTSTRQTVLDNEQMRLRHQRMSGPAIPRRLANQHQQQHQHQQQQQRQQNLSSQSDLNVGHAVTKSSTAEEVSESKQLLFRKHIGDQRAAKLATLRQKYLRQPSDDTISSIYPNSSRSTVRDATCSSISSAVPSSHDAVDPMDSSWKETEELDDYQSLGKSDSFEYANSVDRLRIRQMEKYWSRDEELNQMQQTQQHGAYSPLKANYLQTISEVNSQPSSPYRPTAPLPFVQRHDTINSDLENFSENDVFYNYPTMPKAQSPLINYRRQFSQPLPQLQKTPTPSPPKMIKPPPPFLQQTSFPRNRPGFLQFFGPNRPSSPLTVPRSDPNSPIQQPASAPIGNLLYPSYQPNLQRWKSEARENLSSSNTPHTATSEQSQHTSPQPSSSSYAPSPQRCGSEAPPTTTSAATFPYQTSTPIVARRFDLHRDSPAVSETSTVLSGYTPEYLEKARKFGKVVSTVRKPGHHVGPTKNPNCSCESCQRWMAERFQLRGRAFSLGERPILKPPSKF